MTEQLEMMDSIFWQNNVAKEKLFAPRDGRDHFK